MFAVNFTYSGDDSAAVQHRRALFALIRTLQIFYEVYIAKNIQIKKYSIIK